MSDYFRFRDSSAWMNTVLMRKSKLEGEKVTRHDFVFKNVKDLTTLLNMGENEMVSIDEESLTQKEFLNTYFCNANRIYINSETEFIDRIHGTYSSATLGRHSRAV